MKIKIEKGLAWIEVSAMPTTFTIQSFSGMTANCKKRYYDGIIEYEAIPVQRIEEGFAAGNYVEAKDYALHFAAVQAQIKGIDAKIDSGVKMTQFEFDWLSRLFRTFETMLLASSEFGIVEKKVLEIEKAEPEPVITPEELLELEVLEDKVWNWNNSVPLDTETSNRLTELQRKRDLANGNNIQSN